MSTFFLRVDSLNKFIFLALLLVVLSGLTGCLPKESPKKNTSAVVPVEQPVSLAKTSVSATLPLLQPAVAFLKPTQKRSDQVLIPRNLDNAVSTKQQALLAVLHSLLDGPTQAEQAEGLFSEIPEHTKLLGFELEPTVVTLNLNKAFTFGGGAYSVQARWEQVTATVNSLYPDKTVKLLIEGKPTSFSIGGEGLNVNNEG